MKKRFVILGAGRNKVSNINPSLVNVGGQVSFINWQIETSKKLQCTKIDYVAGYQIEDLKGVLPESVHIIYNPVWAETGALYSLLLLDFNDDEDLYIIYNDIIIDDVITSAFLNTPSLEWKCLVDMSFPRRYGDAIYNCEIVKVDDIRSEFIGFLYVPHTEIHLLKDLQNNIDSFRKEYLSNIIIQLENKSKPITYIDCQSNWCDINFPEHIAKFILRGKAKSLENLRKIAKKSNYLEQIFFSTTDWSRNQFTVYQDVLKKFSCKLVVVRSCSAAEDGFSASAAGAFESHLGINLKNFDEFSNAVTKTIKSYDKSINDNDLVLIQPFVNDGIVHGVVFTQTHNGGPYYIFNYILGNDTEGVTKGTFDNHQTFYFYKYAEKNKLPDYLQSVFEAVQEIEAILCFDSLDIEFVLEKSGVCTILQVRPQVSHKHSCLGNKQDTIEAKAIIKKQIETENCNNRDIFENLCSVWAVMPDWNPAEIIGRKPSPLALSLYEELVTNDTWAIQRSEFGYHQLDNYPLMKNFYGMCYIDVKASFLSFIPSAIEKSIALKIVKYALDYLISNPHFHDKVEFDVIPTCYRFDFKKQYDHILKHFSDDEVQLIEDHYKDITWNAISFDSKKSYYQPFPYSVTGEVDSIFKILNNCKKGVLAFAHEARKAFIATNLLKSLVCLRAITQHELDGFYQSLNTISKEFSEDAFRCQTGKIMQDEYVKKYGHLRPGTYDITASRYDINPEIFIYPVIEKSSFTMKQERQLKPNNIEELELVLKSLNPLLDYKKFIDFAKESIVARERVKFEFSKDLSCALENIAEHGKESGFSRAEMAFCDLKILNSLREKWYFKRNKAVLNAYIQENMRADEIRSKIEMPIIFSDEKDVEAFSHPASAPNFISSQRVVAEKVYLNRNFDDLLGQKIVMIENADPGFDWIFSENISGLVTMYGGINSHMAIRAAEYNIPTVVGVGEKTFNELLKSRVLLLDCKNKKIISTD